VACGPDFAIAIAADDGTVWGTGVCDSGQLGLGDYPQRGGCRWQFTRITGLGGGWQQASCGNSFAVLRKDGVLYGAGSKGSGRLASSASSGYFYEFTQISDKTDWVFVDAGEAFTFAIDAAGNLWATGLNSSTAEGCLGLGDGVNKTVFTQCAGTGWAQVSGGWTHAAAVRADGTLWTTGDNSAGQLGQGDNTRRTSWTQVGAGTSWAACCCGNKFTLAVKTDGTLWAAGLNTYGQLGLGDNTSRNVFVQLSGTWPASLAAGLPLLAAGEDHCAALTLESALAATGRNNYYQLGDTTTADATVMTAAAPSVPTGEAVDEWAAVGCTDYGTIVLRSP
jgi:alpha-tubulin suppressor-like RCC1 family protein